MMVFFRAVGQVVGACWFGFTEWVEKIRGSL